MNLQTANVPTPDSTKGYRAGAALGQQTANNLLSYSKMAQSDAQFGANLKLKQDDQEMSFRERNQRMAQAEDLHPLKIKAAQEQIHGQIISNNRTLQDIEHNDIKFGYDIDKAETDIDKARSDAEIAHDNLKNRRDAQAQAPALSKYNNDLANYNNMPPNQNTDPNAIPKPPTDLTGPTKAAAWRAYEAATKTATQNRGDSAAGLAQAAENERIANLVSIGALNSSQTGNPRQVVAAQATATKHLFDTVLGGFNSKGVKGVPKVGSGGASALLTKYTLPNGTLNEVGLRGELNQKTSQSQGMTDYEERIDEQGNVTRVRRPKQRMTTAVDPADQQKLAETILEQNNQSLSAPQMTFDEAWESAGNKLDPAYKAQKKGITETEEHDLVQYMYALSQGENEVEYATNSAGVEYVKKDEWNIAPDPDAVDVASKYLKKINESGLPIVRKMGTPPQADITSGKVLGKIYWGFSAAGDNTQFLIWTYDEHPNSTKRKPLPPQRRTILDKVGNSGDLGTP